MKSVGEVMSIGRSLEEVLQKALRMLDIGMNGFVCNDIDYEDLDFEIEHPSDRRFFLIAKALENGYSVDRIHELSKIDKWFLYKMKNIIDIETDLKKKKFETLSKSDISIAKKAGFSDNQLAIITNSIESDIRKKRIGFNVIPCVKQIDTLAAEYPAQTNYLYMTYNGDEVINFTLKK
jgi:hypothetical protein